jgi:ABC-type transporter Mla subunit MlaD
METQAPPLRRLLPIAALALVVVLIAIFGWRSFGGAVPFQASGYRLEVPIAEALNMEAGADVTISGVHVGDVIELRRDGYQPVAEIDLKPRYAPLHEGARAIPRTKSLLGEAYIEITRGNPRAPLIPENARLPVAGVARTQSVDDVLETFSPAARRNFKRLATGMSAALRGRGVQISSILGNAPLTTGDLAHIMSELDGQRPDLGRLISNSADVFAAMGDREGALRAAVRAGDSVLGTTARSERALRATVRSLPPFLDTLTTASGQISGASGDLTAAVNALRPVAPKVRPALTELRATAPRFEQTFVRLRPVMSAATRGLPAIDQIARAFGKASPATHDQLRELVPVLQLAREIRGALVSFFANVGSVFNGTTAKPGGKRAHVVSAMPSFWNETIGGWIKRLPSNRPNPYPIPGSAIDIAHGGLKTFDCRQIHNRLYIPPTGGRGAPPCVEQGPWTFNGKTAYYPQLSRAAP